MTERPIKDEESRGDKCMHYCLLGTCIMVGVGIILEFLGYYNARLNK